MGRSEQDGTAAPDGDYTLHFTARDRAGTNGAGKTRDVRVVRLLGSVKTSAGVFFPHDNDRLAKTASLSFALARPATVTWTIRNAAGQVVVSHLADAAIAAGTQTWVWDGTNAAGARLPLGSYTSYVTASDGTDTISQSVRVEMNAFSIGTSTATPKRGSKLTITVSTAEPLESGIFVYITEPG